MESPTGMEEMNDADIARLIEERGLEVTYLRELLASLGFDPAAEFGTAAVDALEAATYPQRRRAALRTIGIVIETETETETVEGETSQED
ncbi:MAG TPA: hypothetical protein VFE05_06395 [Longimicrobiaceae bacterium]|jgi:hypothetical protein|nr:hypothetical protein [Longimicrobiaceae bacterium]